MAGLPWTPGAADFAALERRLAEAEDAARWREADWRQSAEQSRRAAEPLQQQLAAQSRADVQERADELDGWKHQLDAVLAAARLLHVNGVLTLSNRQHR
jgi:uncharacterized protein (DUF2235 family)